MIRIYKRRGTLLWSSSFCYVFFFLQIVWPGLESMDFSWTKNSV